VNRISNTRVRRKYTLTNEQHDYLNEMANKLTALSGKRVGVSDVLCGMIDHYRLGINEKTK
jgi:hypothetical protein